MALIQRLSRLFKADAHAVLDRIEEPEALLKQAIRDMEDALAHSGQRITLCTHDHEATARQVNKLETTVVDFAAELDLCFQSDKDDLARSVIRKKLEAEQLLEQMCAKYAESAQYIETCQTELEHQQATLDSLRQKAALFDSGSRTAAKGSAEAIAVSDDQVEIAMLRERALRSAS